MTTRIASYTERDRLHIWIIVLLVDILLSCAVLLRILAGLFYPSLSLIALSLTGYVFFAHLNTMSSIQSEYIVSIILHMIAVKC